jgi:siroheme synthase
VVPGVSSAIAGPAAAGIPVTLRGISRSFAVLTAHEVGNGAYGSLDLSGYSGVDTLVLLMGRGALRHAAAELQRAGRSPDLPVACVQHATLPTQRTVRGTLATIADLADASGLEAPMVTVVGEVAAVEACLPEPLQLIPAHLA